MPFDPSKPLDTSGGFDPSKPLDKSPPPPKEKPGFGTPEHPSPAQYYANPKNLRSPLKDLGAAAYGFGTGLYGAPGDLADMLGLGGALPTTDETRGELAKVGVKPPAGEENLVEAAGIAPALLGGAEAVGRGISSGTRLAKTLGTKLGDLPLVQDLTGAKSAARTEALAEAVKSGQTGKQILSRATKAAGRRKDVADNLYEIAKDRMNARFDKGETWQESSAGREFFNSIRAQLSTDKATTVSADTRKILTDVSNELAGTPRKDGTIAYATPEVLVRTLRDLRDAAKGAPKEGFKALAQHDAKVLADKLSASLAKWEPFQQVADAQYAHLSAKRYPEGVEPGKFSQEKASADQAISLLETRLQHGTLKSEEVTSALRDAIKQKAVARLVAPEDARRINAELDAIDAIKAKEARAHALAKWAGKYIGGGALLGAAGAVGYDAVHGGL